MTNPNIQLPYSIARCLIQQADVLLFRHDKFPGIGWFIGQYTRSPYSHVGLAHWEGDKLYCIEFREFKGSRHYPLSKYICAGYKIDVFRPCLSVTYPIINEDEKDLQVLQETKNFTPHTANDIIYTSHDLLGEPYSYWVIWQIFKLYIPFVRFFVRQRNLEKNDEIDPKSFVCSTLVTFSYRKHFLDPVPCLPDSYTTPGDLARSQLFHKLFEIR